MISTDKPFPALTKVTHLVPLSQIEVLEYLDRSGRSLFGNWFESLNSPAAAKIVIALTRLGRGNFSNAKSVGSGVQEYRIDFGPGYRVYFGKDGERVVILLGGGSKKRQQRDISAAIGRWQDYKHRKQ